MTLDEIKRLIEMVQESSIVELDVAQGDDRVRIVREHQQTVVAASTASAPAAAGPSSDSAAVAAEGAGAAQAEADSGLIEIKAPMVGTFYRAPAPDAPPYIEVGAHITEGQTICIIEAMKLMNEIPADRSGTVVEIAIDNAQPVEYGQTLIRIKPD